MKLVQIKNQILLFKYDLRGYLKSYDKRQHNIFADIGVAQMKLLFRVSVKELVIKGKLYLNRLGSVHCSLDGQMYFFHRKGIS